jgi:hypothetical protein
MRNKPLPPPVPCYLRDGAWRNAGPHSIVSHPGDRRQGRRDRVKGERLERKKQRQNHRKEEERQLGRERQEDTKNNSKTNIYINLDLAKL